MQQFHDGSGDTQCFADIDQEENNVQFSDSEGEENQDDSFDVQVIKATGTELMGKFNFDLCKDTTCSSHRSLILPPLFSQSDINGRNGSNACTVISLVTGYFVLSDKVLEEGFIADKVLSIFIGCMEIGNLLHDGAELLTVQDALVLLPHLSMEVYNERNCFRDSLSTTLLESFETEKQFVVLICADRSISILFYKRIYYIFDSHQHDTMGASIFYSHDVQLLKEHIPAYNDREIIYLCDVYIN